MHIAGSTAPASLIHALGRESTGSAANPTDHQIAGKPFIDENYRTKFDFQHTAMIGSSLGGNITQFMRVEYQEEIGCLSVFSSANWLHQEEFDCYIKRHSLNQNQRVFIYVGTEEADDTDKTLMAGNIKQAYVDSSVKYYHTDARPKDNNIFFIDRDRKSVV